MEKDNTTVKTCHKLMEKRRREKINSCITELSKLIPDSSGSSQYNCRKDKSDILESTVNYLRSWQSKRIVESNAPENTSDQHVGNRDEWNASLSQRYFTGYRECAQEVLRYLTEVARLHPHDPRYHGIAHYLQLRTLEVAKVICPPGPSLPTNAIKWTSFTSANRGDNSGLVCSCPSCRCGSLDPRISWNNSLPLYKTLTHRDHQRQVDTEWSFRYYSKAENSSFNNAYCKW